MRTRVKYCGLVRPQDVDAAVAIGADAVGFVFYRNSPRLLDIETAAALRRQLPSWVRAVGLFVNEPPEVIDPLARRVGLDVVQLHGDETVEQAKALSTAWWKALRIGGRGSGGGGDSNGGDNNGVGDLPVPTPQTVLQLLRDYQEAEFCLLDSFSAGYGGSGKTFDWSLVPPETGRRLIMSGGLDADNVAMAIARIRPFAVDTSSGIQAEHPREKDVGRMERFMEAVRLADGMAGPGPTGLRKQ